MNNKLKAFCFLTLFALSMSVSAQGTSSHETGSYGFVQFQGGVQLPFSPGKSNDLMQPNYGLNIGVWVDNTVGIRVGTEGLKSKVLYGEKIESFNYYSVDLDLMVNLVHFFSKQAAEKNNLYLLGSFLGLTYRGDVDFINENNKSRLMHNLRVGIGYERQLSKHFNLSLEFRLANTNDKFNFRTNNFGDWYSSLMLGVAYKFGHSYKSYDYAPVVTETAPLSLYEQMQQGVNERMNTWVKRLKGESKTDYLARTNEQAMESQRLEFTKTISTDLAGNRINTNVSDLKYNKNTELLNVGFTDMPSITLRVPNTDLASIKGAQDLQFSNTVYNLNPGDKFEVLYTDAINPTTNKKYTYINQKDANFVESGNYVPLTIAQEDMANNVRLEKIKTNMVQEAKDKNILSDNTNITVATQVLPLGNGTSDYRVSYSYTVKEGFSVTDDFAPGKYDADKSAASTAMLKIINQSLKEDFAKYLKPGKAVDIIYTGSADARPITGKIAYSGKYGDLKDVNVNVNQKTQKITVTRATGITTNEQLSLVRAISVKDYLMKNVDALKEMKTENIYNIEVSNEEGSQYRRVAVDILFHNTF